MLEKGVRTQAQLLRLLEKEGFKVSQLGFSSWLYGHYTV
jgi:arginine repressor